MFSLKLPRWCCHCCSRHRVMNKIQQIINILWVLYIFIYIYWMIWQRTHLLFNIRHPLKHDAARGKSAMKATEKFISIKFHSLWSLWMGNSHDCIIVVMVIFFLSTSSSPYIHPLPTSSNKKNSFQFILKQNIYFFFQKLQKHSTHILLRYGFYSFLDYTIIVYRFNVIWKKNLWKSFI